MKTLGGILFSLSLMAALYGSTIEGYEAFGTFAVGLLWVGIVLVIIAIGSDDLQRTMRESYKKENIVIRILTYPFAAAMIFVLILSGHPVTAIFYLLAMIISYAIKRNL